MQVLKRDAREWIRTEACPVFTPIEVEIHPCKWNRESTIMI